MYPKSAESARATLRAVFAQRRARRAMLTGLWTIGIKVPDLERELAFHRHIGNQLILDETLEMDGEAFRVPLLRMGDKYLHLAEKMVYERLLGSRLPYGITHLVYKTSDFDADLKTA